MSEIEVLINLSIFGLRPGIKHQGNDVFLIGIVFGGMGVGEVNM